MNIEVTRISSKGQVVIPQEIREQAGFTEGETISVTVQDSLVVLKKIENPIKKEDLKTLKSIKEAWQEIKEGKCRKLSSEDFLKEIDKW